jgi:hypothetical protein
VVVFLFRLIVIVVFVISVSGGDYLKKLKERLDRVLDVKSYGYVVDKRITRSAFVLILLLGLIVLFLDGSQVFISGSFYYECPCDTEGYCVDPFTTSYLPVLMLPCESVGYLPSWLARNFAWLSLLIFVSALLCNHYVNNKNWKVKRK